MVDFMTDTGDLTRGLENIESDEVVNSSAYDGALEKVGIYASVIGRESVQTWRALKRMDERDINNFDLSFFDPINSNLQLLLYNLDILHKLSGSDTHMTRYLYGADIDRFLGEGVRDLQADIEIKNIYDPRQVVPVLHPYFDGVNDITQGEMIGRMLAESMMSLEDFNTIQDHVNNTMDRFMAGEDVHSRDFHTNHMTYYILNSRFPVDIGLEGDQPPYERGKIPQKIIDSVLMAHHDGWLRLLDKPDLYSEAIRYALRSKEGKNGSIDVTDLRDASYPLILTYVVRRLDDYESSRINPIVV